MWKKWALVICTVLISILTYTYLGSINLNSENKAYVQEFVREGNYTEAYKHYGTVFKEEPIVDEVNGDVVLKGYKSMAPYIETVYLEPTEEDLEDEDYTPKIDFEFYSVQPCLDFVLFNLEEFDVSVDLEDINGGVYLTFNGVEEPVFFPFVVKYQSFVMNKYDYQNHYTFLPISIYEKDIISTLGLAEDQNIPQITNARFVDESEEVLFNANLTLNDVFDTVTYSPLYSYFDRVYAVNSKEFRKELEKDEDLTTNEINDLLRKEIAEVEQLLKDVIEEYNWAQMPSDINSIIGARTWFIVRNVLLIITLIVINVVIFYILVIRKKETKSYQIVKMPTNKNTQTNK